MDLELFRIINRGCRYQPWNTQQKQQVFNVPGIKIDVRNVVMIMHSSFIFNVPLQCSYPAVLPHNAHRDRRYCPSKVSKILFSFFCLDA